MSIDHADRTRLLSDQQIAEMLALVRDSDSVELKLTVAESAVRSTVAALELDPLEAQIRQVFFFDTADLDLNRQGVVVRARRAQHRGDDSVVKLRPVEPTALPDRERHSKSLFVEVDAMPGGFVCSASMKGSLAPPAVKAVAQGAAPIHSLFSKEQRSFFKTHTDGTIGLDALLVLGPITLLKLRYAPPELARKMVAEMWFFPDGSRTLELSTKCAPAEPFQVAAEVKAFLMSRGVDLTAEQQTKTKTALTALAAAASPAG